MAEEEGEQEVQETPEEAAASAQINPYTMSDEEITTALNEQLSPKKEEAQEEVAATEQKEGAKEEKKEEAATPPTLESIQTELASFKENYEKAEKRNRDKDAFITRLQEENKVLRQQPKQTQTPEQAWEKLAANPDTYIDQRLKEATLAQMQLTSQNELAVRGKVENFDDIKEEIAQLALEDGLPEEAVRNFKADPWLTSDPYVVIDYARRVNDRRKVKTMEQQVTSLQARIDQLTKEQSKKAEAVVKQIEQATKQTKGLTAGMTSPATTTSVDDLTDEQIWHMSAADIDRLLKERIREQYGG